MIIMKSVISEQLGRYYIKKSVSPNEDRYGVKMVVETLDVFLNIEENIFRRPCDDVAAEKYRCDTFCIHKQYFSHIRQVRPCKNLNTTLLCAAEPIVIWVKMSPPGFQRSLKRENKIVHGQ